MTPTGQLALVYSLDDAESRDEGFSQRARSYILALPIGAEFTSDALRASCGDPSGSGCSVGSVIHSMQNAGHIRFTGRSVMSERPKARGRWVRVWRRA